MTQPLYHLAELIRSIPDYPVPGVVYRDITPLLRHPQAFRQAVDMLASRYEGRAIDAVAGIESRGFLFSAPLALRLGVSLVPIRKFGKLPAPAHEVEYYLHFGPDKLQLHQDALQPGARVLVCDDLIATGSTVAAACELVEMAGGVVEEIVCLVELKAARAHDKLASYPVFSLIKLA
jgi:adenine phosphoribosyltransferase